MKRLTIGFAAIMIIVIVLLGAQAAAKNRNNPPVRAEPQWDSPDTRQLAVRACFDCHSNETRWPLYSGLPIVGNLISSHVIEGRRELNFSEWGVPGREQESEEAAEKVFEPLHYTKKDALPQPPYSLLHPKARLSQAEREQLAAGLTATFGESYRGYEADESSSKQVDEDAHEADEHDDD